VTSSLGQGLALRAPTLDDVPALAAFFRETQVAYGSTGPSGEDEIRHELTSGLIDREADARLALRDGRIVGAGEVWDQTRRGERVFIGIRAHPRERAVYATLLDWAEARGAERATARPGVLRAWRDSDDEELEEELTARGFGLIRHFFRMQIDLDREPPPTVWPDGIALRTFRPGDERPIYDAVVDAFADHWDFVPMPYEDWLRFGPDSPTFDPELQLLAADGDEIAGVALCQAERRPDTGHVGILGVRPRWRRRGLALALLLHAFREFRRRGRPRADLGVDAENTTGAVRLYERAGMRPVHRMDTYERKLA
jgi:mycothiol synthase